jgi:hypothetical protein
MEKKRKLRINAGNWWKVKISIHRLISRLQDWDDIQVLCCLSSFRKLQKYNNQSYISEDWKQKFLNLNWLLHLQKYIKNIYIL